jgi:hypothetical protein
MRLVKLFSLALAVVVATAGVVHAQGSSVENRFGKGPSTIGLTAGGGNYYSRGNVYYAPAPSMAQNMIAPAPAIAIAPATGERRSFSAEPAAPQTIAPAAVGMPTVGVFRNQGSSLENRFGKGPTTIGLSPGRR